MPEISIVDTNNLMRAAAQHCGINIEFFSITILRHKLDRIMLQHQIRYPDVLISRIIEEKTFFHFLLRELFDYDLEIFRDPELWQNMNSDILPDHKFHFNEFKILIPACTQINELYSMYILLHESGFASHSTVDISLFQPYSSDDLNKVLLLNKIKPIEIENFYKVFPDSVFEKYFLKKDENYRFYRSYLKNTGLILHDLLFNSIEKKYNLIFFREKLTNYSTKYQNIIIEKLASSLEKKGLFIIGYRENRESLLNDRSLFKCIDANNMVYMKIK